MTLRLAHRILCDDFRSTDVRSGAESRHSALRNMIAQHATIVIANNVNEYIQSIIHPVHPTQPDLREAIDGMLGMKHEDIPCVTPPMDCMFIEHDCRFRQDTDADLSQAGSLFVTEPFSSDTNKEAGFGECDGAVKRVTVFHFYADSNGKPGYDGNMTQYLCGENGEWAGNTLYWRGSEFTLVPLVTPLMTISFMHCKKVEQVDVTASEGPTEKWLRRQRLPKIRYHILSINPMREVLRSEGDIEHNGLKKALHICRGHFVRYTEDKPLFGKYSGMFWKQAHVRGSPEEGVVLKDYQVSLDKNGNKE